MRIDIIVPNFDNSSDEVTLSSWYKNVGDKISKNEIIADAETPSVACGITSSYDCILARILVREGDIISQGTKIAVIETDLNADMPDVTQNIEKDETEDISTIIAPQIEEEEIIAEESVDNRGYSFSVPLDEKSREEVSEEIIEDFSEHTEEKCLNILKNAESQAREEALKLKEKILEEAQKLALIQAEELKVKVLKEYEEKATKDAGEMHQKIVQGSIQEAEATKAKLIEEAKEKAKQEAESLRKEILDNAKKEAKEKAEAEIEAAVACAKEEAKQKAESLSKEIIEETINESKNEAKAIKKDIIHSAQKHAAKESADIVKDVVKDAKIKSRLQAEELIESTAQLASREAESLREQILKTAHEKIREAINSVLHSVSDEIRKEAEQDIRNAVKSTVQEIGRESRCLMEEAVEETEVIERIDDEFRQENEVARAIKNEGKNDLCRKIISEKDSQIEEQAEIIKRLLNSAEKNDNVPELYADNLNSPNFFESTEDYSKPTDTLRRRISEKMKNSYDASVISTVSNEVDMSAVLALEKTFGIAFSKKHHTRLGFTPFFISACIAALKQYRVFNSHIYNDEIIYKNNFDISIITCGNDGIAAPVIRHADTLTIAEIEKSMIHLSKRAMEGTLLIEEVSGGTFTVINAGIYGSLIGTDLLTPPQVATLSVHKMHNRPVATDNGMEIKPMLYISLSYDHRVSDTRKASEFLSNIKNYVENPGWQILGL
ncbi:MAG: 2-oxo acid dehydrogenase subunit E2 [Holosporaceae bacterium]|jgi:2-oxoglutarate dehydrogenase E2 component (dihydrolipoamide succinyltransferase)|nr:2-oxo acid dehydrogenase subunit E2 [Holosporaceae bacterium]